MKKNENSQKRYKPIITSNTYNMIFETKQKKYFIFFAYEDWRRATRITTPSTTTTTTKIIAKKFNSAKKFGACVVFQLLYCWIFPSLSLSDCVLEPNQHTYIHLIRRINKWMKKNRTWLRLIKTIIIYFIVVKKISIFLSFFLSFVIINIGFACVWCVLKKG